MEKNKDFIIDPSFENIPFLSKETLIQGLNELISIISAKGDYIVPIARRGIRTLQLSPKSKELFNDDRIIYIEALKLHAHEDSLKNKRIILFDESIGTGKTIKNYKKDLEAFSKINKLNLKIKTSSLLIRNNSKYRPRYYLQDFLLTYDEYEYFSNKLIEEIFALGKPLDVDHLILDIALDRKYYNDFVITILNKFKGKELWHSKFIKNLRLFTIDLKNNFKMPFIDSPALILDEGPKKIRIYLRSDGFSIIPIIYPAMQISDTILNKVSICPFLKILEQNSPCKILSHRNQLENDYNVMSRICYSCIVNYLNAYLASDFLIQLKEYIPYVIEGLDEQCIQTISHDEKKRIIKELDQKIKNAVDTNQNYFSFKGNAPECRMPKVDFERRKFLLNDLRPEVELSLAIVMKKNEEKNLFYVERSTHKLTFGLSYNQFSNFINEMDYNVFSEAIDIGLDTGYFKPFFPLNGVSIPYKDSMIKCIIRLYSPASEYISQILTSFNNLITIQ